MFLNMLNEREGKLFLELANIAMRIDGIVDDREKRILDTYRREMSLLEYELKGKAQEDIVSLLQGSKKSVKRAIIIEIAGVLDADDVIDDKEHSWIYNLGEDWGFRETEIKKMVRWTQDFNDLLQEGLDYINKR